jgi:hypothetical protein
LRSKEQVQPELAQARPIYRRELYLQHYSVVRAAPEEDYNRRRVHAAIAAASLATCASLTTPVKRLLLDTSICSAGNRLELVSNLGEIVLVTSRRHCRRAKSAIVVAGALPFRTTSCAETTTGVNRWIRNGHAMRHLKTVRVCPRPTVSVIDVGARGVAGP